MKVDLLGAKCLPSDGPIDQAVVPLVGLPSESVHSKAAPPQGWTSIPRCFLYQSHSALGSLALMKMPPMPVTLFIRASCVQLLYQGNDNRRVVTWSAADRWQPGGIFLHIDAGWGLGWARRIGLVPQLVDEHNDAITDRLRARESHPLLVARVAEKALPGPEDDGEHHQAQLIDEVMLDQRLYELGAAVHHDVATGFLPQLRDLRHHVASEHRRVVPLCQLEGRGDVVLRHPVELVRELVFPGWPSRGKALVGHPAEQQRLGVEGLVELELVALFSTADVEGPTCVPEALASARGLHNAVERDEFGYHDSSHLDSPFGPSSGRS